MGRALRDGNTLPVLIVLATLVAIWYLAAIWLNAPWQLSIYARGDVTDWSWVDFVLATWSQDRPVLPSPHQVLAELWKSTVETAPTSKRSLVYHGWITLSSTLLGFLMGTLLGIGLAVAIVHNAASDRTLMPWLIASQTIPILAIAPMVIVVLNAAGISGLIPKALISTYLSFFPVAVGMVKGLRSPEQIQLDLMHTYNASAAQIFWKLRWPNSMPFLFTSMKVGVAASLVGAIVAELPAGAAGGYGARLLAGSYYGQTVQIWSALFAAATLAALLVISVGLVERSVNRRMGARA
jgi:NitT/TauT family transport system permease protein